MKAYVALCLLLLTCQNSFISSAETRLSVEEKKISVLGKEATIYAITQNDGTLGLYIKKSEPFAVRLENSLKLPTSIHWHGLILPNDQDGVAFVTQFPIYPGQSYSYNFPLVQAGTFWMHSHLGMQEQRLLAAPLIITEEDDANLADSDAVIMLADFSFTPPVKIYQELRSQSQAMSSMKKATPDIVEVDYDAFLANYKTLEAPDIIRVEAGKRVRLRCINSSSATNFLVSTGTLEGVAIAVDGNRIQPLKGSQFTLGVAQRIDIVVEIPKEGGFFALLAQAEGTDRQTGVILATDATKTAPKISSKASQKIGRLDYAQEASLHALYPLSKKAVDNTVTIELGGNMSSYEWTLNGQMWPEVTPPVVEKGQRVAIIFKNVSGMTHPMHLHGHVFQVTAINGQPINGAMRDTLLVPPLSSITVEFDADNPGVWPLHCHVIYHLEAGMFTVLRYKDFQQPL